MNVNPLRPLATARAMTRELARGYRTMTPQSFFETFAWDVLAYRRMRLGRIRSFNDRRRIVTRRGTVLNYRRNRGDIQSIREVWLDRVYSVPFGDRPQVVVDLGANIGLTSLFFCEQLAPQRLVSVEPDPGNAEILRLNTLHCQGAVEVVVAAVGHEDGVVHFAESEESNLGHVADSGRPVRCVSVPSLMQAAGVSHIDLLKIDIEGGEGRLLSLANGWLDAVGAILIEFHPNVVDEPALVALLKSRGFRHFTHDEVVAFGGNTGYFRRPSWPGLETLSA